MLNQIMPVRPSVIALAISLLLGNAAWAQTAEGSLYGRTKAGAAVTITAIDTGTSRQIKAEADGTFTFSKLPPGRYRVSSGGVTRDVSVAIGSGSEVVLDETQQVQILGSRVRSGIDTSSVESNSVFTQEQIRSLPVARSADAVALLAPGTVRGDNFKTAGDALSLPSFGGASIAENGYYINGMDVTNIRNFLSYAELPFDAIGQQQVKTGGYGAEYGRSLGGVVSLVTKRGTNQWKGGASFYWEPRQLRSSGKDVADKEPERAGLPFTFDSADKSDYKSYVLYGGGPIVKDRLFIFGALEAHDDTESTFGQDLSTKRTNKQPNAMVKIDWSMTDSHLFEFTGITNKRKLKYLDYTSATPYSPNHDGTPVSSTREGGGDVLIGKYTGYLTDDLTVSALVGRVTEKRNLFTGARTLGQECPVVLDLDLSEIGCWIGPFPGNGAKDQTAPRDEDKRKSFRFDVEYSLGKHMIRAGLDNQTFDSSEAGGSTFTGGAYYRYFTVGASGAVNGVTGFTPGSQYVRKRVRSQTSGVYEVKNSAYYVEDSWKVLNNLMLYGGLRWESFVNKNSEGIDFVKRDNLLAPRTGFAWDVNGDAKTKVFANYGRYYIPVASNTNIRATRAELATDQFYTFASRDPVTQGPVGLGPQIGVTVGATDGRQPDPGTVADTQLKPMNQDEFILGIQRALSKELVVGSKLTYRKINDGMDDYCDHTTVAAWIRANVNPTFVDNLASCMLMNPGRDLNIKVDVNDDGKLVPLTVPASALRLAKYERTYKALEFSVERPFDGRWGLQGSYTWSKSVGTAEGYVQSNLDQSDAGLTQDFDFGSFTDGSKGYLPNDRRHVFKLFGTYQVAPEWLLGMNGTLQSGRPISCIGFVPPSVPDFGTGSGSGGYTSASSYYCIQDPSKPAVLVQRGSVGRTPWTSSIDLSMTYTPEWALKKLSLQVSVFNLFNSQKTTEVSEVRDYSRAESSNTVFPLRQSANYQSPTSFQTPRYVRLTARYEF